MDSPVSIADRVHSWRSPPCMFGVRRGGQGLWRAASSPTAVEHGRQAQIEEGVLCRRPCRGKPCRQQHGSARASTSGVSEGALAWSDRLADGQRALAQTVLILYGMRRLKLWSIPCIVTLRDGVFPMAYVSGVVGATCWPLRGRSASPTALSKQFYVDCHGGIGA